MTRWQKVDELFHAALEHSPEARDAFLEAACVGDISLLAEVRSLVNADDASFAPAREPLASMAAAWLGSNAGVSELSTRSAPTPPHAAREQPDALIGRTLAQYEIQAKLGSGGMGEVYLARDLRLSRLVALKCLPATVAADSDRSSRFVVEARAASALSHRNVASIYDLCDVDGQRFIVMEYVEGQSLDAMLRQGALLPVDVVFEVLIQIASALDAAHRAGITHRDIKPANLMVTADGVVKVLDFGLAKLTPDSRWSAVDATMDTMLATTPGLVMGTVQYMSPEQALGRPVDHRSDLFSLGVVAYQALTGRLPFEAESLTATIDAIVHEQPRRPSKRRAALTPAMDRVLMRAIAKSPSDRYQHAVDFSVDLGALRRHEAPPGAPRRIGRHLLWRAASLFLAVACVAGMVGATVQWPDRSQPSPRLVPFTSFAGAERYPAFSPDGTRIAYAWDGPDGTNHDIYVHAIGGSPLRLTTDAGTDAQPAFSPDGALLAFVRDNTRLLIVGSDGGTERDLGSVPHYSTTFAPDGRAVVVSGGPDPAFAGLTLVPIDGSPRRPLTHPPAGSNDIAPAFAPSGRRVAFLRVPTTSVSDIWVANADGSDAQRLTFDEQIIEGLAWTQDGHSIVFGSTRTGLVRLWRVDASGGLPQPVPDAGMSASMPAIARVGGRLAFNQSFIESNLWEMTLDTRERVLTPPRLSAVTSTWPDGSPDYSPDGLSVAFVSSRSGRTEIWVGPTDSVVAKQMTDFSEVATSTVGSPRWSPDGQHIAFDARVRGNADIYVIAATGGSPRRLTEDANADVVPTWSRDGRSLYFTSRRSGRPEVWRVGVAGGGDVQITSTGGFGAQESLDGRYLLYGKDRVHSPLWRRRVSGGPEEPVLVDADGVAHAYAQFALWRPTRTGVIFVEEFRGSAGVSSRRYLLRSFDIGRRRATTLLRFAAPPTFDSGGLALSADARRLMFTQQDRSTSDIMLIESFR